MAGDNVNIATDVSILNHDIMSVMINNIPSVEKCKIRRGGGYILETMYSLVAVLLSCMM